MLDKTLNSANIDKVTWENNTLRIYFITGEIVAYHSIPEGMFVGLCSAKSAGSFLNRYIKGEFNYAKERECNDKYKIQKLEHHEATTVGLWATDRPEVIPDDIKDYFFRIGKA